MKKLIREQLRNLIEAVDTIHSIERFYKRLQTLVDNKSISTREKNNLEKNLKSVNDFNFDRNTSYAIKLGSFNIRKESPFYRINRRGDRYYSVPDPDAPGERSEGNEFWCVVRHNKIITIMLTHHFQVTPYALALEQFKVDRGVLDIDNFIELETKRREIRKKTRDELAKNRDELLKKKKEFKTFKLYDKSVVKYFPYYNKIVDNKGNPIKYSDIENKLKKRQKDFIMQYN